MALLTITLNNFYSRDTRSWWWRWPLTNRESLFVYETGSASTYDSAVHEAAIHMRLRCLENSPP